MKNRLIGIVILLVCFIHGCEKADETFFDEMKYSLVNTWVLTSVLNYDAEDPEIKIPDEINNTLRFQSNGEFHLQTLCNQGSGNYRVSGDSIRIWNLSITYKECISVDKIGWEELIVEGLNSSSNYTIVNEILEIMTAHNYILRFKLCTDTAYEVLSDSLLYGIWEWKSSCGGISGNCESNSDVDYTQTLELTYSGDFILKQNDSVVIEDRFVLKEGSTIFNDYNTRNIVLQNSQMVYMYSMNGDQLILNENCYDCYQHEFVRIRNDLDYPNYLYE